jgi:hypothetical protein
MTRTVRQAIALVSVTASLTACMVIAVSAGLIPPVPIGAEETLPPEGYLPYVVSHATEKPTPTPTATPAPPSKVYSVADACILQGYPTMNFGDTTDMGAGYDDYMDPDGRIVRSLVRFNLSAIPTGTSIDRAVLRVYLVASWDFEGETRTITTYRITSAWSEFGVTWNNKPSFSTAYGSAPVTHGAWGWYSFDVTGLVRGWVNGTMANRGVMLRGPEWSGSDSSWKSFSTREGPYPPRLVITYSGAGASTEVQIDSEALAGGGPPHTMVEALTSLGEATVADARLCDGQLNGNKCLAMQ